MDSIVTWFKDLWAAIYCDVILPVAEWFNETWADFYQEFHNNFIKSDRWFSLVKGLGATLQITFGALLLGMIIGLIVAAVRSTYDKNSEVMAQKGGAGWVFMRISNAICNLYLTIFRGTPVVVQLMIFYFVIFAGSRNGIMVATIAFGINSGAYVAEIFRSGIVSVDNGQFEAGRSLGFSYLQTMIYIIVPQAFKTVLPTLCNEFIVLLKETSIAGYVGVVDLTKAGDIIRGRTFSAFMPLIMVALVYLLMVVILTALVRRLERRLQKSER